MLPPPSDWYDAILSPRSWRDADARDNALLVLRFDGAAEFSYVHMTRHEILHTIRDAELSPASLDTDGVKAETARAVCDLQPVHMRDLRQLDESFAESNETSIVVRKQAILISADPIRSIVLRHSALVLVPNGADSLLLMLIRAFQQCVQDSANASSFFEFKALEAILDTLSRLFEIEFERHAIEINDTLNALVQVRIISGELETLRLMKNSMSAFAAQVDSLRRTLMALHDNEEDLRLLYLTRLYETPALITELRSFDPEEVEVLLETYMKVRELHFRFARLGKHSNGMTDRQDIYSTRTKAELLQHRVHATESLVTMKLDYARNYLLALQLVFSLVGVGLGIGTLVTGVFGMNVQLAIPTSTTSFWIILSIILVASVVVIWGGVHYFRRQGLMIAA
ncbi:hypothetical protein PINS_up001538 [Pythium insidiosum]|nr:hypothetical protein PINS_up001538 [Pythium insidiosum]